MAKFCAQCGYALSEKAAFCGGCGAATARTCPTCGQNWPEEKKAKGTAATSRATKPEPKQKSIRTAVPSARIQPIYGPKFDEDYDCSNCGAKDQNDQVCIKCGEDNE